MEPYIINLKILFYFNDPFRMMRYETHYNITLNYYFTIFDISYGFQRRIISKRTRRAMSFTLTPSLLSAKKAIPDTNCLVHLINRLVFIKLRFEVIIIVEDEHNDLESGSNLVCKVEIKSETGGRHDDDEGGEA